MALAKLIILRALYITACEYKKKTEWKTNNHWFFSIIIALSSTHKENGMYVCMQSSIDTVTVTTFTRFFKFLKTIFIQQTKHASSSILSSVTSKTPKIYIYNN